METKLISGSKDECLVNQRCGFSANHDCASTEQLAGFPVPGMVSLLLAKDQGIFCDAVSPSNVRNHIHKVSLAQTPKHKLNKEDTNGHAKVAREKPTRPPPHISTGD